MRTAIMLRHSSLGLILKWKRVNKYIPRFVYESSFVEKQLILKALKIFKCQMNKLEPFC